MAISLAMLMLIFTDLLLISRFGWIMAACVVAAMIADLVVTPALLAGPMGGLIERAVKRRMSATGGVTELRPHFPAKPVAAGK
jgi:hypothetical protein